MKYSYIRKPRKCPKCGALTIARILWGMPAYSEKLIDMKGVEYINHLPSDLTKVKVRGKFT